MNLLTENYFETLSEVIDAIEARCREAGCRLVEPSFFRETAFVDGVPYGETSQRSAELLEYRGKATRKYAHATLYRMESGRYELTFYVL